MGYGVTAYAVRLDLVVACFGARDRQLLTALLDDFGQEHAIDRMVAGARPPDRAGPPVPTARDLVRHLVMDEPVHPGIGFAYGYCFKHICERYGESLDNSAWYPVTFDFVEETQAELSRQGVSEDMFSIADLVWGGVPVRLPPIDDFPGIGHLPHTRVPAVLATLGTVDTGRVTEPKVRAGLRTLVDWLTSCRHGGRDLVCFYH